MVYHTPKPPQKEKSMSDETQEPIGDDDLRAREAVLWSIAEETDLGQDGSIESLNAWARLHRIANLLQEDPSEVRDQDESIANVSKSNQPSDTAAALQKELVDKTSHHKQEPSIAGPSSARPESHEPSKDSERRLKKNTRSTRQDGNEPSVSKQISLLSAVPPSTPESNNLLMALDSLVVLEGRTRVPARSDVSFQQIVSSRGPETEEQTTSSCSAARRQDLGNYQRSSVNDLCCWLFGFYFSFVSSSDLDRPQRWRYMVNRVRVGAYASKHVIAA
ncbi:hypothetical protein EV127DRAFT_424259 [Xylaria flabelliformis]|nr:hypothetical protein EV127DRAFT_424259 [Xylaria flabelliformis]